MFATEVGSKTKLTLNPVVSPPKVKVFSPWGQLEMKCRLPRCICTLPLESGVGGPPYSLQQLVLDVYGPSVHDPHYLDHGVYGECGMAVGG